MQAQIVQNTWVRGPESECSDHHNEDDQNAQIIITEMADLSLILVGEQNVAACKIPVHDVPVMHVVQSSHNFMQNPHSDWPSQESVALVSHLQESTSLVATGLSENRICNQ